MAVPSDSGGGACLGVSAQDLTNKKLLNGPRRLRPGGPESEDAGGDEAEDIKMTDDSLEPCFYRTLTYKTVDECVHDFGITSIVDLTHDCGTEALGLHARVCAGQHHSDGQANL